MKRPPQYFRAGVGAMILDRDGRVLALERSDHPGEWQLPQGGLARDEEPLEGVYREIAEETGLPAASLELVVTYPEPLAYELPSAARSEKTGRGQVHYWFLFRLTGDDRDIDVTTGREFRAWQWMTFDALVGGVTAFRRLVYRRLREGFRAHLARGESSRGGRGSRLGRGGGDT